MSLLIRDSLEDLLDEPFRLRKQFREQTRFSDGSFRVFYSSLDAQTAEAEARHWFMRYMGKPGGSRTMHYHQFSCTFEGIEKTFA